AAEIGVPHDVDLGRADDVQLVVGKLLEARLVLVLAPVHGSVIHDQVDVVPEHVEVRSGAADRSAGVGVAGLERTVAVVIRVQPDIHVRGAGRVHDVRVGVDAITVGVEIQVLRPGEAGARTRHEEQKEKEGPVHRYLREFRLGGVIGSGEWKISWREIPPGSRSTGTMEGDGIRKRGYVRAGGNTKRNEEGPGSVAPGARKCSSGLAA